MARLERGKVCSQFKIAEPPFWYLNEKKNYEQNFQNVEAVVSTLVVHRKTNAWTNDSTERRTRSAQHQQVCSVGGVEGPLEAPFQSGSRIDRHTEASTLTMEIKLNTGSRENRDQGKDGSLLCLLT